MTLPLKNMVAIITDGTAVLGLGYIGPEAAIQTGVSRLEPHFLSTR